MVLKGQPFEADRTVYVLRVLLVTALRVLCFSLCSRFHHHICDRVSDQSYWTALIYQKKEHRAERRHIRAKNVYVDFKLNYV